MSWSLCTGAFTSSTVVTAALTEPVALGGGNGGCGDRGHHVISEMGVRSAEARPQGRPASVLEDFSTSHILPVMAP